MKKIILISCIIISIIWVLYSLFTDFFGLDYMSYDKISLLYNKNCILFNDIADKMMDFPDGIRIEKKNIINDKNGRSDWIYYEKNGFWVISTTGEILTENDLKKIDNLPLKKLFRKTKIDLITKEHTSVSFVQASNLYFCVGITFNLQDNPPNPYIHEWKHIKDNWYYFVQK